MDGIKAGILFERTPWFVHSRMVSLSTHSYTSLVFIGFKQHGGFDQNKALYCIIDPEKFGEDQYWVDLFRNDPAAAEREFSNPDVLTSLAEKYGVVVVDGAHRW